MVPRLDYRVDGPNEKNRQQFTWSIQLRITFCHENRGELKSWASRRCFPLLRHVQRDGNDARLLTRFPRTATFFERSSISIFDTSACTNCATTEQIHNSQRYLFRRVNNSPRVIPRRLFAFRQYWFNTRFPVVRIHRSTVMIRWIDYNAEMKFHVSRINRAIFQALRDLTRNPENFQRKLRWNYKSRIINLNWVKLCV